MIFAYDKTTDGGVWELLADSGELLGRAYALRDGTVRGEMTDLAGGRKAWATDLELLQSWMMEEAHRP
jgi:hypothetical protein